VSRIFSSPRIASPDYEQLQQTGRIADRFQTLVALHIPKNSLTQARFGQLYFESVMKLGEIPFQVIQEF